MQSMSVLSKVGMTRVLEHNPGVIILRFGAEWCAPCKSIESLVHRRVTKLPPKAQYIYMDIDQSIEIYAFLKNKKVVHGIPAILAYYQENVHYIPDDCTIGSDPKEVNHFFDRCEAFLKGL